MFFLSWKFPDPTPDGLLRADYPWKESGAGYREEKIEDIGAWSENVQFVLWVGLSSVRETHEFGLAGMFASETVARCALRWQVLHRRAHQQSLLPLDLSCTYSQRKKCPLLS